MQQPLPRIVRADFAYAVTTQSSLPPPTLAEIAFAGRSNVGKSSLLNMLVERRNLVRAGGTPGTTRQINFFSVETTDGLNAYLVDLPGYGYAKRSKAEKTAWGELIEGYLSSRPTLRALVLLVDIRRGVEDDDRQLLDFITAPPNATRPPVPVVLVGTKMDKLAPAARKPAMAKIAQTSGLRAIGVSATTGEGRVELWRILRRFATGQATGGASKDENESARTSVDS